MIKYKKHIPFLDDELAKTIQKTPLLRAKNLSAKVGVKEVYLKLDSTLPYSHTFKDRGAISAISYLLKENKDTLICASCGNMSSAMAPVSARAGIDCCIILSSECNIPNKVAMSFSGAKIIVFNGRFDEVDELISKFSENHPNIACINTNLLDVYMQGLKTVYYELFEDLSAIHDEINIIIPTADGTLLKAIYIAYMEYKTEYPKISFEPHLILAQPNKCAPIVQAFNNNCRNVSTWDITEKTHILSLSVDNPQHNGKFALEAVYNTNGIAIAIDESFAEKNCKLLAMEEGIFTDDVGGIVMGALKEISEDERLKIFPTVCLITGNGLKTSGKFYGENLLTVGSKSQVMEFLKKAVVN